MILRGWLGRRKVTPRPWRAAVLSTQAAEPNGGPRGMHLPQTVELLPRHRGVYPFDPASRTVHRPGAKQQAARAVPMPPKPAPLPGLGPFHDLRAQCMGLDVAAEREKIPILGDGGLRNSRIRPFPQLRRW